MRFRSRAALADRMAARKGAALHVAPFGMIPAARKEGDASMRTFLVITDETEEARAALRFAARRAVQVEGAVHVLALVRQQNFSAFAGVQATIEQEAHDRAEMLAHGVAGNLLAESGILPTIAVRIGNGDRIVSEYLATHNEVAALVLGAARPGGSPGPLVTHFAAHAGDLPCPLYIIPADYDETTADHEA